MAEIESPTLDPTLTGVVSLWFRSRRSDGRWTLGGTAFFVTPTHLLTARHVVDDKPNYRVMDDGTLLFDGEDTRREWVMLLPVSRAEAARIPVRVLARPPDPTLDAVLLELVDPTVAPADPKQPVTWLEGIPSEEWAARRLIGGRFQTFGFPQAGRELPPGEGATPYWRPVSMLLDRIANPAFDTDTGFKGLKSAAIADGKVEGGRSGSPVWITLPGAEYCVGLVEQGAKDSGHATLVGEGSVLPWLRARGIAFDSCQLADLPPEELQGHLNKLREDALTLLVPVLGSHARNRGSAREREVGEAEFIELFVRLHARPVGSAIQPDIRDEAVQWLYEVIEGDFEQGGFRLPLLSEARSAQAGPGASVLLGVRAILAHCARRERNLEPQIKDLDPLAQEVASLYVRFVEEAVDGGEVEVTNRTHVWSAVAESRRLVLTSAPGGGKTTVALFLALALARGPVGRQEPKLKALFATANDLVRRVPVLVRLRDFKQHPFPKEPASEQRRAIEELLAQAVKRHSEVLAPYWRQGRCFLLFDGLDELEGDPARESFCGCLQTWLEGRQGRPGDNRVLVTTRPTAYPPARPDTPKPGWEFANSTLWELEKLDRAQQLEFLDIWFGQNLPPTANPAGLARRIHREIPDRDILDLGEDPLLLAGIAELVADQVQASGQPSGLPETRAAIFDQIVELMLLKWETARQPCQPNSLELRLGELGLRGADLREVLGRLALESLVRPPGKGDFTRDSLVRELQRRLGRTRTAPNLEPLLEELAERSGLVRPLEYGEGAGLTRAFEFPVRSYRNYLAGEALFGELPDTLTQRLTPETQGASTEARVARGVYCAEHGIKALLCPAPSSSSPPDEHDEQALALGLAATVMRPGIPLSSFLETFRVRIAERLQSGTSAFRLIRTAARTALDVRAWQPAAGEGPVRLATPGIARPDWQSLLERAMFSPAETVTDRTATGCLWSLLSDPDYSRAPALEWSEKVGTDGRLAFVRGDEFDRGGGGASRCELVQQAFYICRHPVTVDQYECFVRATGAPRPASFETRHPHWGTRWFETPDHPVVGVSWVEAVRCCEWLTMELRQGRLGAPDDVVRQTAAWEIRLPTEAEWELGARGPIGEEPKRPSGRGPWYRVPWGWANEDEIRAAANCDQPRGSTSIVRLFSGHNGLPTNRSPFGALDMAGNVWEWCLTPWVADEGGNYPKDYVEQVRALQEKPGAVRVVRGGGWSLAPAGCRCAVRYRFAPGYRYDCLGFRPVLAPVPPGRAERE